MASESEIPEFPFFTVSAPTAAFGCSRDKYLSKQEGSQVSRLLPLEVRAFEKLFYEGGRLSDVGFKFKEEFRTNGPATLRALMCSFDCSHEGKTGTVALALHHWCEQVAA